MAPLQPDVVKLVMSAWAKAGFKEADENEDTVGASGTGSNFVTSPIPQPLGKLRPPLP
jgi:hypothetical protein